MDDREGGFIARALDYTGVVFEGMEVDTVVGVMQTLEQTIAGQCGWKDNFTE